MIPHFLLKFLFNEDILSQAGQSISAMTDCDWVRIIYQKMGGNVKLIPKDCCSMNEIRCINGYVTDINWNNQLLTGFIPSELGNLVNLQKL
jgi:hypothetical protein